MGDDATSKTHAYLASGETTHAVFTAIWQWIKRYGIPLAFYVDLKTVYISKNFSHLQKACKKLGILIIKAYSPQAKGRVERKHGVYQDRFVKELRLKKINTLEQANEVLTNGFIDNLNWKFEKVPRNNQSAHVPLLDLNLNQILCWEYKRQVRNDWTFTFKNKCYQVEKIKGLKVKSKDKISVRQHLDGSISAWFNKDELLITLLDVRPKLNPPILLKLTKQAAGIRGKSKSPWNQFNPHWFKKTGS
jgi:hypothetical protein